MSSFLQFLRENDEVRRQALAAGLCALFLGLAWAAGPLGGFWATALFAISYAAGFWYPAKETVEKVSKFEVDVDLLMLLVAGGAWVLGHPSEGAMLLVLFGASRAMEAYARGRTHSSIGDLVKDLPRSANRIDADGQPVQIDVDAIAVGDLLLVRPGERFPVDCAFVEGVTSIDLSAMTGESQPAVPTLGFEIPSGAVNGNGVVRVKATKLSRESAFQKIIALIENAPARRSPAQVLSDRIGSIFTVVILSVSIVAFFVWWLLMALPARDAAYRAMVLLVGGSPCAIVLSIPSAILAAISNGARRGILFNGGRGLAAFSSVKLIAFDKTGTLSTGEPGVLKVTGDGAEIEGELAAALALAKSSTHPASQSVVRYFERRAPLGTEAELVDVKEQPGRGMIGSWGGRRVELGRPRGCDILKDTEDAEFSRVIFYADGVPRIRFYLSESARVDAAATVAGLAERGLASCILSGDVQPAVDRLARSINVSDARGELRPEQKHEIIIAAAANGGVVMVGDGINDAPALAAANVGVAMGIRGSAAALAQADIILVKDRLLDLVEAWDLSRRTRRVIAQNLTIAIGAATLLILTAMAGKLPLALGVFGHEGGTVLVVLNSLRLLLSEDPAGHHAHPDGAVAPVAQAGLSQA